MSIVTVSIVQNVQLQRTTDNSGAASVGAAVADIVAGLSPTNGLDWGTLAVTVTDDPVS